MFQLIAVYLIQAIEDVAKARGKSDLAEKSGITRQGLHKIFNEESVPNIQSVMGILSAMGLRLSVERMSQVSNDTPANILDVAQYVSGLLPRGATYMQLQKIVYYSQVESLVQYKKPLFNEKIEAWSAGPVVRKFFEAHRGLKFINNKPLGDVSHLTMEQKVCIDWAFEKYGKLDGER